MVFRNCSTILKPHCSGNVAGDYRPITLLSTIRKLFEKIVQNRLSFYLERNSLWPETQYGFRKGYGSEHNIIILKTDILNTFARGQQVLALFLDISHAYDSVQLHLLIERCAHYALPPNILLLIYSLFSYRSVRLPANYHNSTSRVAYQGLPQGSSLSPLLYALYVGDIHSQVRTSLKILQFADDIVVYTAIPQRDVRAVREFEQDVHKVYTFLSDLGLSINLRKTQFMHFRRSMRLRLIALQLLVQKLGVQPRFVSWEVWFSKIYRALATINIYVPRFTNSYDSSALSRYIIGEHIRVLYSTFLKRLYYLV